MSNFMVPQGLGVNQIMRILGIADMNVVEFTLTCKVDEIPQLTVTSNPAESTHVGFAVKHFTLTEVNYDEPI